MSVTRSFSSSWGTCWSGAVKRPDPGGRSRSAGGRESRRRSGYERALPSGAATLKTEAEQIEQVADGRHVARHIGVVVVLHRIGQIGNACLLAKPTLHLLYQKRRLQHDSGILNGHLHAGEMSSKMRPRRRDSLRAGTVGQAERSTRYRNLVNPFEPVRIFSDDQVERIHLASLGILERQGMRVLSPRGRAVLAGAGGSGDAAR